MKKYFIGGLLPFLILFGLSYGLIKAADVEVILGTSSGFKIVRGTSVSTGTHAFFVGSSTVSIGTTTQAAMLTIAGSSTSGSEISLNVKNSSGADSLYVRNDGAILIGTNTSNLNSALYVGSATSGSLGTITAGFLSMGTISANAGLHGTTTVRFLADIFANGTITASKFSGDGSGLTGVSASSAGANSVSSSSIVDDSITGSDIANTLSMTDTTLNIGSMTVNAGNFRVDSAGSMTATTITSTGSVTASTLAITGNVFKVDSVGSMTATTIKATGSVTASSIASTGTLTAANSAFVVDETGSMTAARITVSNLGTITGGFLSVGTISANLTAHGTTTVRFLNDIFANGSVMASTLSIAGTATIATTSGANVGIGTTVPGSTVPNGFTSSSQSRIVQISSGGTGGSADVGLAIRRSDNNLGDNVQDIVHKNNGHDIVQ